MFPSKGLDFLTYMSYENKQTEELAEVGGGIFLSSS